jgi:hypothetical protein
LATAVLLLLSHCRAANQTATLTPILSGHALPFRVSVQPYDFGAAELPTLQSFAVGAHDGKWVLLSGRTNGLHGFNRFDPAANFPAASQNRDVWVIDPLTKQSWRRSLEDASSGLTEDQINSLTPTNLQFYQTGDRLYLAGGYGLVSRNTDGTESLGTFDTLSAIDLPGLVDWVVAGGGSAASHIRQVHDPLVKVTGGAMHAIAGRTHLVFGQDFNGGYTQGANGDYTEQVRSFDVVDDGVNLSIEHAAATPPLPEYRRRDLNVFPVLRPGAGSQLEQGLVALAGVFTPTNGAFTTPVIIDETGQPSMADPTDPATFKQGFNAYHSAKLGLFSEATGDMYEVLFGGIGVQYLDPQTMEIQTDNQLPFQNDITAVKLDATGHFSQYHLGFFPELTDANGQLLRFGSGAEFFPTGGVDSLGNGVLRLDALGRETTLGYIFGGIMANSPQVRGVPGAVSSASNAMFEVVLTRVPEPTGMTVAALAIVLAGGRLRGQKGLMPHDS